MVVSTSADYDELFPEEFDWGRIHQVGLSHAGEQIADEIRSAFMRGDRETVGGLRRALQIIAMIATMEDN